MPPPIYLNRPRSLVSLTNKWSPTSDLAPFLNSLAPSTSKAIRKMDVERANTGRAPLTSTQTQLAGTAVERDAPVTPEQDQPWFVDAARDISAITSTIPKLLVPHPNNPIVQEVRAIPQLGTELPATLNADVPIGEKIGNVASLPGFRLVPGSFVASQFGTGGQGVGGITEHPVLSALDVFPYVSKAARATGTVRAATELAEEASKATGTLPRPVRPLTTLATRGRLGGVRTVEEPLFRVGGPMVERVAPNPIGEAFQTLAQRLGSSRGGNIGAQVWSGGARELARQYNRASGDIAAPLVDDTASVAAAKTLLNDEMAGFAERYQAFAPERRTAMFRAVETGDLSNLTPDEALLIDEYRQTSRAFEKKVALPEDLIAPVEYPWGTEMYDTATARKITDARYRRDSQLAAYKLRESLDPSNPNYAPADELRADYDTALADPRLSKDAKGRILRAYERAITASEARPVTQVIDEMLPTLEQAARTDGMVADVVRSLKERNWKRANRGVAALQKRSTFQPQVDLETLRDNIRFARDSMRDIQSIEKVGFTPRNARSMERATRNLEQRSVPARFDELVRQRADETVQAQLRDTLSGDQLDQALSYASARAFPELEQFVPNMRRLQVEARRSWQELAEQGLDPQFAHHVSETRSAQMSNPRVFDYPTSLSQTKKRLFDAGAHVEDLSVALNHQALEFLQKRGSERFVEEAIGSFDEAGQFKPGTFGKSYMEARAEYAPLATDASGQLDVAKLDDLIYRDFSVFDPDSFINPRVRRVGQNPNRTILVPKEIGANLDRLKPSVKDMVPVIDPVMRLFRTSVLPLSPRWHINNILSGLILVPLRAGNPVTVWKNMAEAFRAVRGGVDNESGLMAAGEQSAAGRLAPSGGKTRQAGEWFRDIDVRTPTGKLSFLHNYAAGRTLGRVFNSIVQKSFDANQLVDDFYRNVVYFEGLNKGLAKGMSYDDAVRQGILQSRKILQNWDTLTPLERSTMRMVFPFYSWARHVLKYVLSYPSDHPWRTSFLANLAATEQGDWDTGLPQRLQSLFFLGPTDADGKVSAINLDGMNPFRDVANYATLGGFLTTGQGDFSAITSQLNPILATTLRWAGVDPAAGQPDLYPDLVWDPMTGGLKVQQADNPLLTAATSFVPQSRVLSSLVGASQQFKELARNNPDAAGRYLASSMGLPVLRREVDVPREQILSELRRYQELRDTLNSTLKSGSDITERYPGLQRFKDKLRALDPKMVAKYKPQPGLPASEQPGIADLFQSAFVQR